MTAHRMVLRLADSTGPRRCPDELAVEEPLELRVGGRRLAVTMRTPGADFDLAAGFLVGEGVVHGREALAGMRYCTGDDAANRFNVVDVSLRPGIAPPDASLTRTFAISSSCGLCGRASIDSVRTRSAFDVVDDPLEVDPAMLATFPDRMRTAQRVFDRTGGLHAAALFDGTSGDLLVLREDVGRHNAVDKVVGWALREGRLPLRGTVLVVSGRASFELAQKALLAGIPFLAAVSAPSSLAADLATESGLTLVGFLRGPSMVVYAGAQRLGVGGTPDPGRAVPPTSRREAPERGEVPCPASH